MCFGYVWTLGKVFCPLIPLLLLTVSSFHSLPCCVPQSMSRSSKMLQYVNYRMRITILDGRVLVGTLMAFDRHLNLVSVALHP